MVGDTDLGSYRAWICAVLKLPNLKHQTTLPLKEVGHRGHLFLLVSMAHKKHNGGTKFRRKETVPCTPAQGSPMTGITWCLKLPRDSAMCPWVVKSDNTFRKISELFVYWFVSLLSLGSFSDPPLPFPKLCLWFVPYPIVSSLTLTFILPTSSLSPPISPSILPFQAHLPSSKALFMF